MSTWGTGGATYNPDGSWNAYDTYASGGSYQQPYTGFMQFPNSANPKTDSGETDYWENGARGLDGYSSASTDTTSSVIGGAAQGYQSGGWMGAIVGALSGYYGSKGKKKDAKKNFEQAMELALARDKYAEEIRQKQMKEQSDALAKYTTGMAGPNRTPMNNNLLGGGGLMGAFAPQGPTQPVVNPEQNSYGLMRG